MFKKLNFKIRSLVILTFSLSFIFIGIISYTAMRAVIYDNFIDLSVKNVSQKTNNIQIYMKLIEETSKQVSINPTIIDILKKQRYDTNIVSILDNVKQTHFGVLGVALFDKSGTVYLSNYVTAYPSLLDLKQNNAIKKFVETKQLSFWSVRNDDIAGYYNNTHYNKKYGIVTFASKVIDETGILQGYLFVDIDPQYIYDSFKSSDKGFPDSSIAFIANTDVGILPSKFNNSLDKRLLNEISNMNAISGYKISFNNKYIIIYNYFCDNNKIVVTIPIVRLFTKLDQMMIVLILVIMLLIVLSIFIGVMLTGSISMPLVDLYSKMRNSSV